MAVVPRCPPIWRYARAVGPPEEEDFAGEQTVAGVPPDGQGGAYLLILHEGATRSVHLRTAGPHRVGRAPESEIWLPDPLVSRHHADFVVHHASVTVADAGSANGTRVNGQAITEATPLQNGDVVQVGSAQLVFARRQQVAQASRHPLDAAALRCQLAAECERLLRHPRPACLLLLASKTDWSPAAVAHLADQLRAMDTVGLVDARTLAAFMPEASLGEIVAPAERILARALEHDASARGAIASWPEDGADEGALVHAARHALDGASTGALVLAQEGLANLRVHGEPVRFADPAMLQLLALVRRVARADPPVLILGETGVGKEVIARIVHAWSRRAGAPLVELNCAALPEPLAESELFGHVRGAFTNATADRVGRLEAASGGTIFLDEVGELPLGVQAKLLRVLEDKRVVPVGSNEPRAADVRVLAATNRDLAKEVDCGRFRADLYYRLNVVAVLVPPLRTRRKDISLLAHHFVAEIGRRMGLAPLRIPPTTAQVLTAYDWPGNVRQLRNVIERAVTMATGAELEPALLPAELHQAPCTMSLPTLPASHFARLDDELKALERRRIEEALLASGGVQSRAASLIGMPLRTLERKIQQYGLKGPGRARR